MDGPRTILVVEDHADTAEVLVRVLEKSGHDVITAGTFAEAVRVAQGLRFHLLVCDVTLPDGDGCQLLPKLRSLYALPAIAVTGHGQVEDVQRCRDAGFDAYLQKPIALAMLQSTVRDVLAGQTDLFPRSDQDLPGHTAG